MSRLRALVGVAAVGLIGLALWQLEAARSGITQTPVTIGTTPVTLYARPDADGPLVVVAHGFAGSRRLMETFSLTLAQAGYRALAFDFLGHGDNPVPMSGDVTRIDGTTRLLVDQTRAVIAGGRALTGWSGPVSLVGHSMASDIVVRTALEERDIAAIVAVSMYSEAVTAQAPERLLIVNGAWEPHLRAAARDALALVDPTAGEGETAQGPPRRRAAVAPAVEHVGVLYSATTMKEMRGWLDAAHGRTSTGPVPHPGPWIAALLAGILALAWPLAALLPTAAAARAAPIPRRCFARAVITPMLLTPLLLWPLKPALLGVLVADYLLLHLALHGVLQLALLRRAGATPGKLRWPGALALALFGILVFGGALDRYGADFIPNGPRLAVIAALLLGAIPFSLADMTVTEAGHAAFWRRVVARAGFLLSLGLAVVLDFDALFFLIMILPVIVLYFAIFGSMGFWVARRQGAAAAGLALGVILAWSLGVTFPFFEA